MHRLDVEAALGHPHALTGEQALDAATYTCRYFLPAMRRVTGRDPGQVNLRLLADDEEHATATIDSDSTVSVTVEGPPVQVVLALWGRPHSGVNVVAGAAHVWTDWRALPSEAFQFGTWD